LTNAKENLIKETAGLDVNNDQAKQMAFTHQGERPSIIFGHGLQHDHVNKLLRKLLLTFLDSFTKESWKPHIIWLMDIILSLLLSNIPSLIRLLFLPSSSQMKR